MSFFALTFFSILEGNDDPKYPNLELCFGGRRKFVGGSYVDFGKITLRVDINKIITAILCKEIVSFFFH